MVDPGRGETRSTISGGTQRVALQGRDFRDVHIGDVVEAAAAPVALAQLPPVIAGFTGRDVELAEIISLLDPAGNARAVVVSAVAGLAGVGKTALAIQAAHAARQASWFPGGVLFIDLHGYDDDSVGPGQALDALLRALGVPPSTSRRRRNERAGLYRSVLAQIGDPVLVIADNASSEAQVRLLLPGPGPHRVVVTSRHTLAGLRARLLDVTVLGEEAAVAVLDGALRAARPEDDRIAADRAAGGAAGRDLRRAAAGLADHRGAADRAIRLERSASWPTSSATRCERLEALHYDDGSGTSAPSVAAAFELSYRQLDDDTARVFRLLPVNLGPDISTAAGAVLANQPVTEARKVVGRLVRAHLIETAAGAAGRWRMHDLVRLYARQLSDSHADSDGREQARDRLLRYYLDTTRRGRRSSAGAAGHVGITGLRQPRQRPCLAGCRAARPDGRRHHGCQQWPGPDSHAVADFPSQLPSLAEAFRRPACRANG